MKITFEPDIRTVVTLETSSWTNIKMFMEFVLNNFCGAYKSLSESNVKVDMDLLKECKK